MFYSNPRRLLPLKARGTSDALDHRTKKDFYSWGLEPGTFNLIVSLLTRVPDDLPDMAAVDLDLGWAGLGSGSVPCYDKSEFRRN